MKKEKSFNNASIAHAKTDFSFLTTVTLIGLITIKKSPAREPGGTWGKQQVIGLVLFGNYFAVAGNFASTSFTASL